MKTLRHCLLASLLLVGCATNPAERGPEIWYQPGKTAADAYKDWAECQKEARRTQPQQLYLRPTLLSAMAADDWKDIARDAMRGRGYTLIHAGAVTNGLEYPRP